MKKDALSYRFVGLKRYDLDTDRLKLTLQKIKDRLKKTEQRVALLEDFLSVGPHQAVWDAWKKK